MEHDESNPIHMGPPFRLILSTPRSGSTLLLRLINQACTEEGLPVWCSGDCHPSVYESLVRLHSGLFEPSVFTERMDLNGPGNPCYYNPRMWLGSGMSEDYWRRKFFGYWYLRPIFNFGNLLVHKTTNLGMPCAFGDSGPDSISDRFIRLVKDCYQDHIRLIFIQRDRQEIIESILSTPNSIQGYSCLGQEDIEHSLDEQQLFFARHRSIFDHQLTYQDILSEPIKSCAKLGFQCNPKVAQSIIEKVL